MIKPYANNQELAGKCVVSQVDSILESDIFILFAHHDGTGVFTEFGAALALAQLHGKPVIYAVGDETVQAAAMFHYHPLIQWRTSLEEVLQEIGE